MNSWVVKLNICESVRLVVFEIEIFWEKAWIPVQGILYCISKLEQLYNEWKTIKKNIKDQIKKKKVAYMVIEQFFTLRECIKYDE